MTTIGTMRALDQERGAVRVEDLYETDIRDLWEACATPERLARWLPRRACTGQAPHASTSRVRAKTGEVVVLRCPYSHRPGIRDQLSHLVDLARQGA